MAEWAHRAIAECVHPAVAALIEMMDKPGSGHVLSEEAQELIAGARGVQYRGIYNRTAGSPCNTW